MTSFSQHVKVLHIENAFRAAEARGEVREFEEPLLPSAHHCSDARMRSPSLELSHPSQVSTVAERAIIPTWPSSSTRFNTSGLEGNTSTGTQLTSSVHLLLPRKFVAVTGS